MTFYVLDGVEDEPPRRWRYRRATADDVTDEMVRRGARAIFNASGHRMPSGDLARWEQLTPFQVDQYEIQCCHVAAALFGSRAEPEWVEPPNPDRPLVPGSTPEEGSG